MKFDGISLSTLIPAPTNGLRKIDAREKRKKLHLLLRGRYKGCYTHTRARYIKKQHTYTGYILVFSSFGLFPPGTGIFLRCATDTATAVCHQQRVSFFPPAAFIEDDVDGLLCKCPTSARILRCSRDPVSSLLQHGRKLVRKGRHVFAKKKRGLVHVIYAFMAYSTRARVFIYAREID